MLFFEKHLKIIVKIWHCKSIFYEHINTWDRKAKR